MKTFLRTLTPELQQLNAVIEAKMSSRVPLVEEIGEHLIAAGGKRLRPLVTILAFNAASMAQETTAGTTKKPSAGQDSQAGNEVYVLAAIIEFLHTATLLHDDVIDESSLRRGRATANAIWDNASSVLVGDFLYSRAFQMMNEIGRPDILSELAETTNLIAEGEVLQLSRAGQADTTEQQYLEIIHYKTARLFEAAARCGGLLSGCSEATTAALAQYGYALGMAFQLMDDYLDYAGSADEMGKNVGDDLAEGKPTLPLIKALQMADEQAVQQIRNAIEQRSAAELAAITQSVQACGALDLTVACAADYSQQAAAALEDIDASPGRDLLLSLAKLSTQRTT